MSEVQTENLLEYGAIQSGLNLGNSENLKLFAQQIVSGKLRDETGKPLPEKVRIKIEEKISQINSVTVILKGKCSDIEENKIPFINNEIKNLGENKYLLPKDERFNFSKFLVLIISWVLITCFLVYFYSSVAVNAFSKPYITSSLHLLSVKEVISTLTNFPGLLLVPSIFISLGVFLHYVLDKKGKTKWILAVFITLLTLLLDFVIAIFIHDKLKKNPFIKAESVSEWHSDIQFWIIVFMGFLVYILWSGVFHGWMEEFSKRDTAGRIDQKIRDLKNDILLLKTDLSDFDVKINSNNNEIDSLKNELDILTFSKSDILHAISLFYSGWLQPLTFDSQLETRLKCEEVIKEIKSKIEND